jgi:hypothetical protein
MNSIRQIELTGPPKAMGEAFGEQFRHEVRAFAASRMNHLLEFVRRHRADTAVTQDDVLALAAETLEAHRSYDPAIWAEFEGIARGAGLSHEELLVCNGLTDLRDLVLLAGADPGDHAGECSAFLVPAACTTGPPIIGQTWDMHADAAAFLVVVRRRPANAPETLGLTTVGCLCLIGMNSEGVSVGNTNLIPTDACTGVQYLFTITRALRARSAAEAIDAVVATPRMSGHNYYAADGGAVVNLECSARQAKRTELQDAVFIHTNHYLDPALRALELPGYDLRNTTWRHEILTERFRDASELSVADCWERLGDVTQDKVQDGNVTARGTATVAAVVQCPGAGTLHVCAGGPGPGNAEVLHF